MHHKHPAAVSERLVELARQARLIGGQSSVPPAALAAILSQLAEEAQALADHVQTGIDGHAALAAEVKALAARLDQLNPAS